MSSEFVKLREYKDAIILGLEGNKLGWVEPEEYDELVSKGLESETMNVVYYDTIAEARIKGEAVLGKRSIEGTNHEITAQYNQKTSTWIVINE